MRLDNLNINTCSITDVRKTLDLLAKKERASQARYIACLIRMDNERGYLPNYTSLFDYVVRKHGYSEASASKRIQVARLAKRYREILMWIEAGEINLTVLNILAPIAKGKEGLELLRKAKGKSKRECELLLRKKAPLQRKHDQIKVLQVKSLPAHSPSPDLVNQPGLTLSLAPGQEQSPAPEVTLEPEAAEITFSCKGNLLQKLERAKEVLRAKYPNGKLEDIFEQALDDLLDKRDPNRKLERKEQRKERETREKAEPQAKTKGEKRPTRYIPQKTKDQVWRRDGGQCTFQSSNGLRCKERGGIQYDHIHNFAMGGEHDPANVRLRCQAHNLYKALEDYGVEFMREKMSQPS